MPRTNFSVATFSPPAADSANLPTVDVASSPPADATFVGIPTTSDGDVPGSIGLSRDGMAASGFTAAAGTSMTMPADGAVTRAAVGLGAGAELDAAQLRNAAAAFARAGSSHEYLAVELASASGLSTEHAAQAVVEGVLLARYRYDSLRSKPAKPGIKALRSLTLICPDDRAGAAAAGAARGRAFAAAQWLSRDLANTPHSHLTASRLGEIAAALGKEHGFEVELFDEQALVDMGIGGLLGVSAGSSEPARMIKLNYRPDSPNGRLAMVGKGIMYDSGGIALKPGDQVHAAMKNDMSGAGAILSAFTQLAATGCRAEVTGYLMCTDSMPSGTAMALGDVITIRGGTTVEVVNTDAEGRLVMADGLVLANEAGNDAIIDIATLTGACMRALGTEVAGVMGNDQGLVDQIRAAATTTDEPVWQLPLYKPYRKQLDSPVADMKNLGYGEGGAITAALFLEEFVGGTPWAHIDIAGVALSQDEAWKTAGCSGFGARLLLELAANFTSPRGA
jgi:leucyl aminopeptidase